MGERALDNGRLEQGDNRLLAARGKYDLVYGDLVDGKRRRSEKGVVKTGEEVAEERDSDKHPRKYRR